MMPLPKKQKNRLEFHNVPELESSYLNCLFTCSGTSDLALLAIGVNMAMINFATSREVSPSFHRPNSDEPNIVAPNNAPLMVKLNGKK